MGRHRKPSGNSAAGKLAAVATSGAFIAIPLTQGTAIAEETHPAIHAVPGIDWTPIERCESGFRPKATNSHSTASGIVQFLDSTWRSLGGAAFGRRAKDATVQQQLQIADRAYAQSGLTPWAASEHCWRGQVNVHGRTPGEQFVSDAEPTERLVSDRTEQRGRHRRFGRHRAIQSPAVVQPTVIPVSKYTVRPGDTLSQIAVSHGHTWQQLWEENRATVANPNLIHVGLNLNL